MSRELARVQVRREALKKLERAFVSKRTASVEVIGQVMSSPVGSSGAAFQPFAVRPPWSKARPSPTARPNGDPNSEVFVQNAHKPLLKCLSDSIEKCRELALQILKEFVSFYKVLPN